MENQNQVAKAPIKDRGAVMYQVNGEDVKLSFEIVKNFLVKGNGNVSDSDMTLFISLCKYNKLNPFLNEAYLVKFGAAPASMIVSKEAFMKRAEANPKYEGFKAGIIVKRGDKVENIEGCFHLPTDVLLGGWAEIHREDRKFPITASVSLAEYDKKQSLWNDKPSSMIRKVAMVQALREAFPNDLGALYIEDEKPVVIDTDYKDVTNEVEQEKSENANKETMSFEEAPKQEPLIINKPVQDQARKTPPPF